MTETQQTRARQVGAILLVVLPLFIPDVVIEFTPLAPAASMVIAGILPAVIAWTYAPRYAIATIPISTLTNALAVLVFGHPMATTFLVLAIAIMVGVSALLGLHPVTIFVAVQPVITVISGYRIVSFDDTTPGTLGQALICAGLVALGGLWAVLVGAILLRDESSGPPDPVPTRIVAFYTGALVLLLVPTAYVASTWFLGTTAGWLLLTILLVTRPTYDESRLMIAERALGTVAGSVLAAAVALVVSNASALVLIGTLAMVVAAVLQLMHARYAYFAAFVTTAIVLLNAERGNVFEIDLQRVLYTILGVALVAAAVALAESLLGRHTSNQAGRVEDP
jgi:hypothetical protein